jgi:hypothetical protein
LELRERDRAPFRLTCTDVARLRNRLRVLACDPRFARRPGREDSEVGADVIADESVDPAACIPAGPGDRARRRR